MVNFIIGALGIQLAISVIIVLLILIRRFMKQRYAANMRYFLWLALAVRLLLPFSFSQDSMVQPMVNLNVENTVVVQDVDLPLLFEDSTQHAPFAEGVPSSDLPSHSDTDVAVPAGAQSGVSLSLTLPQIIALVWFLGALISLLFSAFRYTKCRRALLKKATYATELERELRQIKSSLKIRRRVSIMYTQRVDSPLLIGFFRPVILINSRFDDAIKREMILRHELIHLKRGDIAALFVLNLARCLYWFNPLIRYMETLAREDIELSCDEQVIKGQNEEFKLCYAETLLKVINAGRKSNVILTTSFFHNKKMLKDRFNAILKNVRRRSGRLLGGVLLVVILLCGTFIGCTVTESEVVEQVVDSAVEQLTTPPLVTSEPTLVTSEQEPEALPEIIPLSYGTGFENVLYFHEYVGEQYILKSMDEQGEINIFCQREGCTHDSADCDAALGEDGASANVFVYDGVVYSLVYNRDMTADLYIIEEDGYRDNESVTALDYSFSHALKYLYDGKMYFVDANFETETIQLMSLDLSSYEVETVAQNLTTNTLTHSGTKLYYYELISQDVEPRMYAIYSIDLADGEVKKEYETDIEMMSGLWINDGYMMSVSNYHHLTVMDYVTGEQLVITENLGGFVNWEGGYFTYAENTVQNMEATTGSSVILIYVDIPKSFESGEVVHYEQTYIIGHTYPEFSHVRAEFEDSFLIERDTSDATANQLSYYLIDKDSFWSGDSEYILVGEGGGWNF